jgi:hypothetical protein
MCDNRMLCLIPEYTDEMHITSAEPPIQGRCGMTSAEPPIQGRCGMTSAELPIQGRCGMTSATPRYKGKAAITIARPELKAIALAWTHTCNYNSVAFVMSHAWYAPTYFSTFFSVAAEFILRVYVRQSHVVLNSRIHRRNAHHQRISPDTRAVRHDQRNAPIQGRCGDD